MTNDEFVLWLTTSPYEDFDVDPSITLAGVLDDNMHISNTLSKHDYDVVMYALSCMMFFAGKCEDGETFRICNTEYSSKEFNDVFNILSWNHANNYKEQARKTIGIKKSEELEKFLKEMV